MIPERLLPLLVTVVRPSARADRYGNSSLDYGPAATRTTVRAWIEQTTADEPITDGRDPHVGDWLLITNHTDISGRDRIEHDGRVFEVDGPPHPVTTPHGVHHLEARLKTVEG